MRPSITGIKNIFRTALLGRRMFLPLFDDVFKIDPMTPHVLISETKLYRPLEEVFDFFSKAENLNKVTPPELKFKIFTPLPIVMHVGTLIDYQIQLSGIPFRWRTLITTWEPPYRFIDQQLKGPYSLWHHEHTFEQKDGYTLMTDRVHFLSPGMFLEPLINALFVERKVKQIFAHREKVFTELFGPQTQG
jgi:ligand-binding SRPBCC domain-containing protein